MTKSKSIILCVSANQNGHRVPPHRAYMGEGYCEYYHSWASSICTHDEYKRAARVLSRYRQFHRYVREIKPEWRKVGEHRYADNSTVEVHEDKYGNRREIMTVAPGGDVCF